MSSPNEFFNGTMEMKTKSHRAREREKDNLNIYADQLNFVELTS